MPIVKNPEDYTMPPPRPQRHIDDSNWIIENINGLTEKYPDMWIAVLDKEVVIASKDLGKVKTMARKKAREVGRGPCVYIFVESFQRLRRSPRQEVYLSFPPQ